MNDAYDFRYISIKHIGPYTRCRTRLPAVPPSSGGCRPGSDATRPTRTRSAPTRLWSVCKRQESSARDAGGFVVLYRSSSPPSLSSARPRSFFPPIGSLALQLDRLVRADDGAKNGCSSHLAPSIVLRAASSFDFHANARVRGREGREILFWHGYADYLEENSSFFFCLGEFIGNYHGIRELGGLVLFRYVREVRDADESRRDENSKGKFHAV